MAKKCYVCHKSLGGSYSILNPKVNTKWWTPPERYICSSKCYSVLRQLATFGKCSSSCCAIGHMSDFDLDKHIAEVQSGQYIKSYTDFAVNLLKEVGRVKTNLNETTH